MPIYPRYHKDKSSRRLQYTYYWFPYHEGAGVLLGLTQEEVRIRKEIILSTKHPIEFYVRFSCFVPLKDYEFLNREQSIFTRIHYANNQLDILRKQFTYEYPELQFLIKAVGFELNLPEGSIKDMSPFTNPIFRNPFIQNALLQKTQEIPITRIR